SRLLAMPGDGAPCHAALARRPWGQIRPSPIAFGLSIPVGASGCLGALSGRESSRGLAWRLGWLWSGFFLRWRVAHDGADRPGERFEIPIHRVVIGGMASFAFAALEIVAIAVHAIDKLAQHAGVDPALGLGARQKPRLQLVQDAIGF